MRLSETWFIEGHIDFEWQKYRLLAYLQEISQHFDAARLYPQLSDLIFHYNNLHTFRQNKQLLQAQFPRQLSQVDLEAVALVYEKMLADDATLQELEAIVGFAMNRIKPAIDSGTEIYESIEKQLHIEPVGILPLYKDEGYLLLRYGSHSEVHAYAYTTTLFEQQSVPYRGIRMQYVSSWQNSLVHTYTMIKREIIRAQPQWPTPAVYGITSGRQVPLDETLLPIAKRLLIRYISTAAS